MLPVESEANQRPLASSSPSPYLLLTLACVYMCTVCVYLCIYLYKVTHERNSIVHLSKQDTFSHPKYIPLLHANEDTSPQKDC